MRSDFPEALAVVRLIDQGDSAGAADLLTAASDAEVLSILKGIAAIASVVAGYAMERGILGKADVVIAGREGQIQPASILRGGEDHN